MTPPTGKKVSVEAGGFRDFDGEVNLPVCTQTVQRERVVYFIKRPDGKGRASFSVIKRITRWNGKKEHSTVKNDRVTALNIALKDGTLDATSVGMEIQRVCIELNVEERRRTKGVWVASQVNLKLMEEYWNNRYEDHVLLSPERERYALQHAIDNLGPISVLGDAKAIRTAIKQQNPDANAQRRYLGKINCIRKFRGIKDDIKLPPEVLKEFHYLTEADFTKAIEFVESELNRNLFKVLFYTGVRIGEAIYLNPECVADRRVFVSRQVRRNGTIGPRKNKIEYSGIVLPNGLGALNEWVNRGDRNEIPRLEIAGIMKEACKKAFPNQPSKWLTAHDLRHCFVVMLLTNSKNPMNISSAARLIGDSVTTTEKYYARFIRNDDFTNSVLAMTA